MNILSAFICVNGLEIDGMSQHMVILRNAITAMHITRLSGNRQCFHTRITFDHRDHLDCQFALLLQSRHLQYCLKTQRNIYLHIC
jgi:hypothetical protein